MKVKFISDFDIDLENWEDVISAGEDGGNFMNWFDNMPWDWLDEYGKDKKKLINFIKEKYYKSQEPERYAKWLNENFDYSHIKEDLEKLTEAEFPFEEVTGEVTTFPRCPYNNETGTFMVILGSRMRYVQAVAYHEMMHFIIHKHYWGKLIDEGLTTKQVGHIKEALTVLLNPILKKRGYAHDNGYQMHKELRADIERVYKENNKDFKKTLMDIAKIYKEKYKNL